MFLQLTSMKQAWSSSRTKWFVVPTPEEEEGHVVYRKYLRRPAADATLSFLEWLRVYNENPATPKRYKSCTSLVALKTVSIFNHVFFYQHVLMHWPHTDSADLHHPRQASLPKGIRFFVQAQQLLPQILGSDDGVRNHLRPEGHKAHFIETVVYYLRALHDLYRLWCLHVIPSDISDALLDCTEDLYPLSAQQTAILHQILESCDDRDAHLAGALTDRHVPIAGNTRRRSADPRQSPWAKFQVIVGKPGTGKSQVLKHLIHACLTDEKKVAVATPLAILATGYSYIFPDSTCDTVHSFFRIPVAADQEHTINFGMGRFDVIIIDEASMIDPAMFELIAGTLNKLVKRPVIVIAGDESEQQPLRTVGGKTSQLPSILTDGTLHGVSRKYTLHRQFRCVDPEYAQFLDYVRYCRPQQFVLDNFQRHKVLCSSLHPNDEQLWDIRRDRPKHTVLTVSREASGRLNKLALQHIFDRCAAQSRVLCDCSTHDLHVYRDMQVLITQNRDKCAGVVNGQRATVINCQNDTVILRLANGRVVFTHPVTTIADEGHRQTRFPFTPSYAMTICKSQGATIEKTLLWMDSPYVPPGTGYVALSRVRLAADLDLVMRLTSGQLLPVDYPTRH